MPEGVSVIFKQNKDPFFLLVVVSDPRCFSRGYSVNEL
jgi:hypothetical protein